MKRLTGGAEWRLAILAICVAVAGGCGTLRLPRIDPSGERLFLPSGNYTTLASPSVSECLDPVFESPEPPMACGVAPPEPPYGDKPNGLLGFLHHREAAVPAAACGVGPAFSEVANPPCAAVPPTCAPAAPPAPEPPKVVVPEEPKAGPFHRERRGTLHVAPARILAPVGSEVLLVSGLAVDKGDYLPRQVIEWSLAQDSVGSIVAAGDDYESIHRLMHHPYKRSGEYAVTRTSTSQKVVTRGTTGIQDDATILRGQSWVTVSSASEGTSYVSLIAPEAENWDKRRKTATIHWVDVVWTFPAQAVLRAGEPHVLTTTVTKNSGKPLVGWIVRYEVAGGDGAMSFGPNQQSAIEIPTNEAGQASVNLTPISKNSFQRVEIKIIRPILGNDDLPRTVVGQGMTSVTWSAPDPQVRLRGPETVRVGSTAVYEAEISNVGEIVSRGVVASAVVPPNMTYLSSEPPAQIIGETLQWPIGDLHPKTSRTFRIHCRPDRNADVRFCVRAESEDQLAGRKLQAEACVETRVFSSALAVRMEGPKQARVGDTVTFQIELTNTGATPLSRIVIRDRLPTGLRHATQTGGLIERVLDAPLAPGQSQTIALELIVDQPGQLCHTLEAVADTIHTASATACVTAAASPQVVPQPKVEVTISGPQQGRVGEQLLFTMRVTNSGNVPLRNVRIVGSFDRTLHPRQASDGFDMAALPRGELVWSVPQLAVGEMLTREARFECRAVSNTAWARVTIQSTDGVNEVREARLQIAAAAAAARPEDGAAANAENASPPAQITGQLKVSIADQRDPIKRGETTTYIVAVENGRNVEDKNVAMTILLPRGLEFVKLSGPAAASGRTQDGKTISIAPVKSMRPGESLNPFFIEVRGLDLGKHVIQIKVESFYSRQPVLAEEDTTITAAG